MPIRDAQRNRFCFQGSFLGPYGRPRVGSDETYMGVFVYPTRMWINRRATICYQNQLFVFCTVSVDCVHAKHYYHITSNQTGCKYGLFDSCRSSRLFSLFEIEIQSICAFKEGYTYFALMKTSQSVRSNANNLELKTTEPVENPTRKSKHFPP
jgi:hypothetical protein